jgi:hypothetical protein
MLPAEPGTYILVLRSSSTRTIRVGSLGSLTLRLFSRELEIDNRMVESPRWTIAISSVSPKNMS